MPTRTGRWLLFVGWNRLITKLLNGRGTLSRQQGIARMASANEPRVSVIMAAYNVAQYIAEALDSVFEQGYDNLEVIVVNDGAPDTAELEIALAPYRDRIIYLVQENRGLAGARNTALKAATGSLIAILDPDDIWEPDYLRVQLAALDDAQNASVVYCNALFFGGSHLDGRLFTDDYPSHGPVTFQSVLEGRCNVMSAFLAKREDVLASGMFDERLRSCEDLDLCLRMLKHGFQIVYHAQPVCRYRRRPDQLSADEATMCRNLLGALDALSRELKLTRGEQEALSSRKDHAIARMALLEGKDALHRGEFLEARTKLASANVRLRSAKITTAVLATRIAPNTLLRLMRWREDRARKLADGLRTE